MGLAAGEKQAVGCRGGGGPQGVVLAAPYSQAMVECGKLGI